MILGGGVFLSWGKYEIISNPFLATSYGELAFSRKMTLFRANQRPQMWISGRALSWDVWDEEDQAFHASSTVLPSQEKVEEVKDFECAHTYLEKTQWRKRWFEFSSSSLQRLHHPGPAIYPFWRCSQVGILLSSTHHENIFSFSGHLYFQIPFCHHFFIFKERLWAELMISNLWGVISKLCFLPNQLVISVCNPDVGRL